MDSLEISRQLIETLGDTARRAYPEECCGVLVGRVSAGASAGLTEVSAAWPLPNREAGDRRRGYTMAPEDLYPAYRRARRRGVEIVGYYHSHPGGTAAPSRRDLAEAVSGVSYLIVAMPARGREEIRSWRLRSDRTGFIEERVVRGAGDGNDAEP